MKRFLLDTNIASYLIQGIHPALHQRVRDVRSDDYAISFITEAELRLGAARKPAEANVHRLVAGFLGDIEIEAWDTRCAQRYALLVAEQERKGKSLSSFDAMIAAHALVHRQTLVAHDAVFRHVPHLQVEDWTKFKVIRRRSGSVQD